MIRTPIHSRSYPDTNRTEKPRSGLGGWPNHLRILPMRIRRREADGRKGGRRKVVPEKRSGREERLDRRTEKYKGVKITNKVRLELKYTTTPS